MTEIALWFCLARAAWVPCVVLWDERTGELRRVEGPEGLSDFHDALTASRFLPAGTAAEFPVVMSSPVPIVGAGCA